MFSFPDMLLATDGSVVRNMPVTPETIADRYAKPNYPIYKDFVSFFVSGVVGVRKFERNKCHVKYSKYVTVSDEAFTILTLENNWERWSSMAEYMDWKDSDEPSKWTTSKEKRSKAKNATTADDTSSAENNCPLAKRYRGWSAQGIARYNQLFEEIKKERETLRFEEFETYVMEEFRTEAGEDGKQGVKRRKTDDEKALPSARHELWDDDPQEEAQEQTITTSIPRGLRRLEGQRGATNPV
jgi:hypothetical protein